MHLDFTDFSPSEVYRTVIQTLIPRPIAWVLSKNENQSFNLAPFSYFNALASDPPLLMFSVGKKPDGSLKDTRVNIEARKQFVVHIPSADQVDAVNQSSATLDFNESEVSLQGLATEIMPGFELPRISGSPIAYACELYQLNEIGDTPMSMIIGKIRSVYIDDDVIIDQPDNKLTIDALKLNPLGRLGGIDFVTLGDKLSRKRPA